MKKVMWSIYTFLERSTYESQNQIIPFAIFGAIGYPLFYFLNMYFIPTGPYENLGLRISLSFACILLLIKDYWPAKAKKLLPVYWYFSLMYVLPFFIFFMLLINNGSSSWLLNYVSIILLLILLVDWLSFLIILTSGTFFAWLAYLLFSVKTFTYIPGTVTPADIFNVIGISIIMGVIFSRNRLVWDRHRLNSMKLLAATVAHELRTPLTGINLLASGLKENLPILLKNYTEENTEEKLSQHQRKLISKSAETIEFESDAGLTFIDMLLMNVKQPHLKLDNPKSYSIKTIIQEAVDRYPFKPNEITKITTSPQGKDFTYTGNNQMIIHVFYNLLRNALYYIAKANKGEITIRLGSEGDFNTVSLKDTGAGIENDKLPYIFDRFFTDSPRGTGIGLAFCKTVMHLHKGKIACTSSHGEYTEFTLYFPKP